MEKRVLLAIVLSFVVLYGYQAMFPPPEPAGSGQRRQPRCRRRPRPRSRPEAGHPSRLPRPAADPAPVTGDTAEREIPFENAYVRAVFSNRGGVIKSWRLKNYLNAAGEPLELVPQDVPPGQVRPFALSVDDAALSKRIGGALYRSDAERVDATAGTQTLVFEYQDAGLSVSKQFAFDPQLPYVVRFSATVTSNGSAVVPTIQWGPAVGTNLEVNTLRLQRAAAADLLRRRRRGTDRRLGRRGSRVDAGRLRLCRRRATTTFSARRSTRISRCA